MFGIDLYLSSSLPACHQYNPFIEIKRGWGLAQWQSSWLGPGFSPQRDKEGDRVEEKQHQVNSVHQILSELYHDRSERCVIRRQLTIC